MKQLGILDSAFINMEHKNVPQHIGSFGIYDQSTAPGGKVRFKSVIRHFERQIKKIPLFRTRLVQSPGRFTRPYWIVDDNFDVEFHLRHIALPYPGDWRQLCILIARLHSRPIDMSRPLWESYVIEGLHNVEGVPDDSFVIYTKIHHSIVDGGGAENFMAAIHDLEPMTHDDDEPEEIYEGEKSPSPVQMLRTSTRSYLDNVWNVTRGSVQLSQDMARSAIKLAKGEMKAPPVDAPATRFNKPVSNYRAIEASAFDFQDFRMIKNKTNTKVNDVALAVVSGAMRKYLDHHNEHPDTSLVASLPINMRTRTGDTGEANQVGSIFTSLNSDVDDPLDRLIAIHQSTDDAKQFGENAPLRDALKLAGTLSPRLTKSLIDTYVDHQLTKHLPMKINTVISNVPGPDFPLYCSGAKLMHYYGLGVLTPGVGIFHLVFTYCGQITITVLADRTMLPDPAFYKQCMDESCAELKAAVEKLDSTPNAKTVKTRKASSRKSKAESQKKTVSEKDIEAVLEKTEQVLDIAVEKLASEKLADSSDNTGKAKPAKKARATAKPRAKTKTTARPKVPGKKPTPKPQPKSAVRKATAD